MSKKFLLLVSVLLILVVSGCGQKESIIESDVNLAETGNPTDELALPEATVVLIGSWRVVSGSLFNEISFEKSGIYYTFKNDSPFDIGKWEYVDNKLILKSDVGESYSGTYENDDPTTTSTLKFNKGIVAWERIQ